MKKSYSILTRGVLVICVMMVFASLSFAQSRITGKVSDGSGNGVPGATVIVKGTNVGTTSDASGNYAVNAAANNTLVFSSIGFKTQEIAVGNRSVVNLTMEDDAASLNEVVVTGYQTLRKKDIAGAVSIVQTDELKSIKSSSFTQNLAGRASGVTTSTSGSPGDPTNVRIRGISSFTNNEPLYIIDGVPIQDQYQNTINPEDIESLQILKDASMSSIYGSRASNGVIVITTKKGKAGKAKLTYNGSFGMVNSVKGYDEVLTTDSKVYAEAIKRSYSADGNTDDVPDFAKNPSALPKYIHNGPSNNPADYDILYNQVSETSLGTNWWDAITRTAPMHDHNLNLSGGTEMATFNISAGYLKQEGILNFTNFDRATIRANSVFKITKKLRFGENMTYAANWGVNIRSVGGVNNEQGVLGNLQKATPIIPILDIKGNPGAHLVAATGNFTNPTQVLINNKNNNGNYKRFLANFYGEYDVLPGLTLRSNIATDTGNGWNRGFAFPEPYRVEGNKEGNGFNESWNQNFTWTLTNTAQYTKSIGDKHNIGVLVGQEAIASKGRGIGGSVANYFTTDVNVYYLNPAFGDLNSRSVGSGGGESRLASIFGKVDYTFNDKYLFSATVRRDGSSKFLSDVRYGIFPAASLGWRISQESFMKDLSWLSDLKLRGSWGQMGNQNIRDYNFTSIYGGGAGSTFYDINGTNSNTSTGYSLQSRGNESTKWETAETINYGFDAALLNNSLTFVLDIYKRTTSDLLFNPAIPGTAGAAAPPFVNIASMENKGFDASIGYRKVLTKDLSFNTALNLTHYKNKIIKISNNDDKFFPTDNLTERLPNGGTAYINKVGFPISAFQGYEVIGLIGSEAEKAKYTGTGATYVGGLAFKDQNGDNKIDGDDRTIIGSPHPDLTAGLNLGLNWKNFDVNAFMFGSFGNDIFQASKIQNYFLLYNSPPRKDILEIEGKGNNPKLNAADASSQNPSSFYIEDGSYVRLQNLNIGFKLPSTVAGKLGMSNARIYLQGQNLFTITKYSGVDPAVSNAAIGNAGNVNDLRMGYDNGNYPANKIMTLGVNLEF
jgi:TonB-dependent starch-binding outer membrane protein SusC